MAISMTLGPGSVDCSYNVLWIILSQAIEDFGVKEVKEAVQAAASEKVPTPSADNEPGVYHSIVARAPA